MSMFDKVLEACRLRDFMPDNRAFVTAIADIFCVRPLKSEGDNLYEFLETIYNYGRIEGIRAERRRRRGVAA